MCDNGGADTGSSAAGNGDSGTVGRRRLLAATGGTISLSTAGCLETVGSVTGGSDSVEPITIGTLAPDPDSDFIGRGMARGAAVAVDQLNEEGGILGRDVELVVRDTNSSPLEARRQYHRLVLEEDADVTVGVFDSSSLVNILDDIAEQETIHLTTGAATSQASRAVREDYDRYKYHFRVGPTNDYHLGQGLVDFLEADISGRNWERIALLAEDYDWTERPWDVLTEEVDSVLERRYPAATEDFTGLYEEVEAADADVAFIMTAHTGTNAMLDWSYPNRNAPQPADRVPPEPRPFEFAGTHVPMQLPSYWQQTGGNCEYGISNVSATANSTVGELTQKFVSAYRDTYDSTPVYTGYTTYEAILLYAHVAEQAGTLAETALIEELENVAFEGATGLIEFYGPDERFPHDYVYGEDDTPYLQWQRNDEDGETGTQEMIWPPDQATASYQTPAWLE